MIGNSGDKRRVLIVDDNADAAFVLSLFVKAYGHETAVAHGGREALAVAAAFRPEIVFLDLGMPEMDGYEVAVALRSLPGLERIYISALTGYNDKLTQARVITAGFDRHLTKPADLSAVLQVMEAVA
jgi:CheY-like chemotaxis protein